MLRRAAALVAVMASLLVPAGVLGAEISTSRLQGSIVRAYFSNVPEGEWPPPAGAYFSTEVVAASAASTGSGEPDYNYVCAWHDEFVLDEAGEYVSWTGIGSCGEATTLSIDRRMNAGRLIASLPVTECLVWDDEYHECLELIELGTMEIDLTFAGVGPIERQRGTSTGGTAGSATYVWRGVGTSRDANPSGTLAFDGTSLIDGATSVEGWMGKVQEGYVEVYVGG